MSSLRYFKKLSENSRLPKRATKDSAGYDFYADHDQVIKQGESELVKTGVAVHMKPDEVLLLFCRSGSALKANVTLQNAVGVIDADYFPNEVGFIIRNEGTENLYIWKGDRIGQGVFMKYLTVADDSVDKTRKGGFGST